MQNHIIHFVDNVDADPPSNLRCLQSRLRPAEQEQLRWISTKKEFVHTVHSSLEALKLLRHLRVNRMLPVCDNNIFKLSRTSGQAREL
jgi:hypothetical protein